MSQQPDGGVQELQAQLAARDELEQQLTEAQEELGRQEYRLSTFEISFRLIEAEIRKLESWSLDGILASLLGTKTGKIDARRSESEDLHREQKECAAAVERLKQQVAQLTEQVSGFAAIEAVAPAEAGEASGNGSVAGASQGVATDAARRLQRAIETGETLLSDLSGMYGVCSRLRGKSGFRSGRTLLSAAARAYTSHAANGVTGQLAETVHRFCEQVGQLQLHAEDPCDTEIVAALGQLQPFAEPGGRALSSESEPWTEMEVLTRGLIFDLQKKLAKSGG